MIQKLWMLLALVLIGATAQAQQTQNQQDPAQASQTQQPQAKPPVNGQTSTDSQSSSSSSSQEASEEEIGRRKKTRSHEYKKWTYNVGVGANLPRGTTKTFVKGGGVLGGAGVARNFNPYFGFRLDFQWVNLPLRASALRLAQAPGGSDHVYAFTLDPIINVPVTKVYTGYFLIGPSYYHRSGKLDSSTAVPGSPCNPFYTWWGGCYITSLPLSGKFLSENLNELGFNFGGGVARKAHLWKGNDKTEIFGEYRQQHGSRNNITTDWRSLMVGVRW